MGVPDFLALDFDGVLCDGMAECFETGRRTCARTWPGAPVPGDGLFPAFRALRPVVMTGGEMPLLLRAMVEGRPVSPILANREAVRDELVASDRHHGGRLIDALTRTLGEVSASGSTTTQAALQPTGLPRRAAAAKDPASPARRAGGSRAWL